jgi:hypothetical protein
MNKIVSIALLGFSLSLTGCLQQPSQVKQSVNTTQPSINVNGGVSPPSQMNQNANIAQPPVNDNKNVNQDNSLTPNQKSADEKCRVLQGVPRLVFNEESGKNEIFCLFGEEGECTQGELNKGECFKEKK